MNWEVLVNYRSASNLHHVRVNGDRRSLCQVADIEAGWEGLGDALDVHPEDVDPMDRCSVCWSVYERRNREERGLAPAPSRYLGTRRQRTLAQELGL